MINTLSVDPLYTLSSQADRTKANHIVRMVRRAESYPCPLIHPSPTTRIKLQLLSYSSNDDHHHRTLEPPQDLLPNYLNMFASGRNYPATTVRMRQAGGNLPTTTATMDLGDRPADVGGSDRWKYFRRPLVPFLSNFIYLRKEPNQQQQRARNVIAERPASPLTKTVGVQTLYRWVFPHCLTDSLILTSRLL